MRHAFCKFAKPNLANQNYLVRAARLESFPLSHEDTKEIMPGRAPFTNEEKHKLAEWVPSFIPYPSLIPYLPDTSRSATAPTGRVTPCTSN